MKNLLSEYKKNAKLIKLRLNEFKTINEKQYFEELMFCLLTPQSNAKYCWQAVQDLRDINLKKASQEQISAILRTKTRFHNNKAKYIVQALESWDEIKNRLKEDNVVQLRNWLAENVNGLGYKEAGHFLRNIGKSNNKIAILDRHILRNLKRYRAINTDQIKNKGHYFELENRFLHFSEKVGIPVDELDLLFWSRENGEIFK